jgi:hypothetical protein
VKGAPGSRSSTSVIWPMANGRDQPVDVLDVSCGSSHSVALLSESGGDAHTTALCAEQHSPPRGPIHALV